MDQDLYKPSINFGNWEPNALSKTGSIIWVDFSLETISPSSWAETIVQYINRYRQQKKHFPLVDAMVGPEYPYGFMCMCVQSPAGCCCFGRVESLRDIQLRYPLCAPGSGSVSAFASWRCEQDEPLEAPHHHWCRYAVMLANTPLPWGPETVNENKHFLPLASFCQILYHSEEESSWRGQEHSRAPPIPSALKWRWRCSLPLKDYMTSYDVNRLTPSESS